MFVVATYYCFATWNRLKYKEQVVVDPFGQEDTGVLTKEGTWLAFGESSFSLMSTKTFCAEVLEVLECAKVFIFPVIEQGLFLPSFWV